MYADSGINLSKKLKYIKGEALCLQIKATSYRMPGRSAAQGMYYAMKALPLFEKQKEPENIIICKLLIGWTLENQQYPRLCVDYVLKVLPAAEQINSKWLGYCYTTLAINYKNLNILDSALLFGLKADPLMPNDDSNIATIAAVYLKMHETAAAERYLSRSIKHIEHVNSHTLNTLSELYKQKKQVDSAIYFAKEALEGYTVSNNEKRAAAQAEIAATILKDLYQMKSLRDSMTTYMQVSSAAKDILNRQEKVNLISMLLNEQSQRQAQLIQSEKMASLGELTAGIAHEIQNPLNFVNNFSEVNKELLGELKDEAEKGNIDQVKAIADSVIENQEKINHHGEKADDIVKGMLQHSGSSSGQQEPTDINALCNEYLRLAYHGFRAKDKFFNADLKTSFDESVGKINVVPQEIGRVMLNLINNAFYAVQEKKKKLGTGFEPRVSVSSSRTDGNVEIRVSDNQRRHMIKRKTTKPTGEGTGLGLSLVYDIMKGHGGDLTVKTKEGTGSEFLVVFRNI